MRPWMIAWFVGCAPAPSPDVASSVSGTSTPSERSSGATASTGLTDTLPVDSGTTTPSTSWSLALGEPVDLSAPGGLRDSHLVGTGHGPGWLLGWTAEVPGGGTKSTALRLIGPSYEAVTLPSVVESEGPAMVPVGDEVAVAYTDVRSLRTGLQRITAAGQPTPILWLDGASSPNLPFAADLAAAPDGSVWALWSDVLWTVQMEADDFAVAPDGQFRLAHVGVDGRLIGAVEERWTTAPGGKHPPDVEVLPDGRVVCVVSDRGRHDEPANLVLERVDDGRRTQLSTPGEDGSRPNMAVDADGRLAIVWREGGITSLEAYVAVYDHDLNLLAGPHALEPGWTSDRPTVLAHDEGWLVAWEKPDPIDSDWTGHRELAVRLLSPDGTTWRTEPVRFDSDDRRRRPAFAHSDAGTLLLWEQGPNDDTFVRFAPVAVGVDAASR